MSATARVALITGGSRGIGRAVCLRLSAGGAYTYVNYLRNEEAARETLQALKNGGGDGELCPFDVADREAVGRAVTAIVESRERIDILVNNAGVSLDGLLVRIKEADLDRLLGTNLKGTFHCCQAVSRYMMRQRWGRIINISSVVAESGNAGQGAYAAAKAGILGLTKSLARELGSRSICVNAVSPGFIETDMTAYLPGEVGLKLKDQIPLGRLGTPRDVAGVVAFLASEEAGYITGQVIRVNGGLYM
jgi:3-oxoacyl-[acyl-carrier protein] reductase